MFTRRLWMISWIVLGSSAQLPGQNEKLQIANWVEQLQANDAKVRTEAARSLLQQGTNAWDEIAKAVWGDFMNKSSARALDAFVQQGSDAVPLMLGLIHREHTGLLDRNPGITGLFKMGTNAMPGLAKTLQDPDPAVRFSAIDPLRILGDSSSAHLLVTAAKTEKDNGIRLYAIDALGYFGLFKATPEFVCEALRELLHDNFEKARLTAAYSFAKACRASDSNGLQLLVKGVSSNDNGVARESAFALNSIGTNAASVLPGLIQALDRADDRTADELCRVFANLGDPAYPILEKTATNLARGNLRISALNSLGDFSISTRTNLSRAAKILFEALTDRDRDIRQAAVNSLRRAALERKEPLLYAPIGEKLRPMLDDPDKWIRDDVKRALEQIESIGARKP